MGIATSAPELFTNILGVFIMKGDMGVGTIVGSAVFNHLAICGCIGLGTNTVCICSTRRNMPTGQL
jgi:Ca2+/Na+ antiporter